MIDFIPFPKISRYSRNIIITEKLDGTNAQITITEMGEMYVGSRTRWISPGKDTDNFGFASWAKEHESELLTLGPGTHFGEWWGLGIQRGYGLHERRFSLFNVNRWGEARPSCCGVVPTLYEGPLMGGIVEATTETLRELGSKAAPGFMKPEGVVVFHSASRTMFKKTLEKDESPKGLVE